jgi:hypothetical protein
LITPAQAAQILLDRRAARNELLAFTTLTNPYYVAADFHKRICLALEAIERGDIDRLMLFLPPRTGKSELGSRRFPAWYLGRNPLRQVICASYSTDLAVDFGRDVRNMVNSPEYKAIFPAVELAQDSQAANRWHTNHGGSYVAAGVGASITGRGADLLNIDDPIKDRREADSKTVKDALWAWYRSTAYTRLMPKASIVLTQTRWSPDDLAGRILNQKGEKWELIEFPAINDKGEALWPERYPRSELDRTRAVIGEREFSALYQQKPMPDEGTFFQRNWFGWYDPKELPECRKYMTSDFAVTEDDGDFTSIATHGVDANDDIYVAIDYWTGQTSADHWIDEICHQILRNKPMAFFGEGGPIRRSIEPFLLKRMRERKAFCRVDWVPSIADKTSRARAIQARASMGKVKLPNNEWGYSILSQLLSFPAGLNDDDVDMLSLLGRVIDEAHPATTTTKIIERPKDRYDRLFEQSNQEHTWRM